MTLRVRRTGSPFGFALVELLVVIAIIGILVALLSVAAPHAQAALKHQYTFNNVSAVDSASGANGTVVDPMGITSYTQGGQLNLSAINGEFSDQVPFTAGAYVDLPNDIISGAFQTGTLRAATFETWVTVETHRGWAEIYAFGTSNCGEDSSCGGANTDYITLIPFNGAGSGTLWSLVHPIGGGDTPADAGAIPTGVQHHIVSVFDQNDTSAGPNGTITLYLNGQFADSTDIHVNLQLDAMVNNNNWLGRSQWNDPLFDGLFNEFRIYDHPLAAQEVSDNFAEGPVIPDRLELEVDTNTGSVLLKNIGTVDVNLDLYRIESPGGALSPTGWNSLDDQNIDAVDGPDGGGFAGDSQGEGWDEAGSSDEFGLSELFLQASSTLTNGASYDLGAAFNPNVFGPGKVGDLSVFIVDPLGEVLPVPIEYVGLSLGVPGDYNQNGVVDAADYSVYRDHLGEAFQLPNEDPENMDGMVTQADYDFWVANFGNTAGAGAGSLRDSAVPEPTSWFPLYLIAAAIAARRRTRTNGL